MREVKLIYICQSYMVLNGDLDGDDDDDEQVLHAPWTAREPAGVAAGSFQTQRAH